MVTWTFLPIYLGDSSDISDSCDSCDSSDNSEKSDKKILSLFFSPLNWAKMKDSPFSDLFQNIFSFFQIYHPNPQPTTLRSYLT